MNTRNILIFLITSAVDKITDKKQRILMIKSNILIDNIVNDKRNSSENNTLVKIFTNNMYCMHT